jgi:hypothetical protein
MGKKMTKQVYHLEDEPKSGAIFVYLFVSATLISQDGRYNSSKF